MNYFAHFFFDSLTDNHYYNAGLVLPDFARAAEGSKRINTKLEYHPEEEKELLQLNLGSHAHYERDKHFHTSEFFRNTEAFLAEEFARQNFPKEGQRLWFVTHILLELLMDRVLIQHYPEKLKAFYHSLATADLDTVLLFLSRSGKNGEGNFAKFWKHFIEVQYLQYYTDDERFLFSLNRTIMRGRQPELTGEQETTLLEIIYSAEPFFKSEIEKMIREEGI